MLSDLYVLQPLLCSAVEAILCPVPLLTLFYALVILGDEREEKMNRWSIVSA